MKYKKYQDIIELSKAYIGAIVLTLFLKVEMYGWGL
tara:strand:+ start:156 stop:263 length:108 start_codon:yes stop_codon:yes gene_type:complete